MLLNVSLGLVGSKMLSARVQLHHRLITLCACRLPPSAHYSTSDRLTNKKNNVILLGSPGSGKTTVGRLLGARLGKQVLDVDNDFLESHWGMTVTSKLDQVGGDNFVEEEGKATMCFNAENSVISLSGSNPMYKPAMEKLKAMGTVVFLDVKAEDILQRLERMKVNRIVGQTDNIPMADILVYRQQFYEGNYDIRVLCEENESPESIVDKLTNILDSNQDEFVSTRSGIANDTSFNDVVLEGLCSDGGLFVPQYLPTWTEKQWERLVPLTYQERALRILEAWISHGSIHPAVLARYINTTYTPESFDCRRVFPVVPLHDEHYIGELFRGPTASFKDAALQLMPKFFHHAMVEAKNKGTLEEDARFLILVATSGDTGGAVLYGFNALNQSIGNGGGVSVMVLYPEHGISSIQRTQMTTVPTGGLRVIGVDSDFDFCQTSIKQIFRDKDIAKELWTQHKMKLSAANSINWGRLLPQVVYHGSMYLDMVASGRISMGQLVDWCIPTGNFGNILAAYYAKRMGLPIGRLICASNDNNVLTDFISTGLYDLRGRPLKVTASPAIDILRSSNLERYLYHTTHASLVASCYDSLDQQGYFSVPEEVLSQIQQDFTVDWCTQQDALTEIKTTYQKTGYVMDPHTAVGRVSALRHSDPNTPMLLCSTAHPAKFADHVLDSLNSPPPPDKYDRKIEKQIHELDDAIQQLEKQIAEIESEIEKKGDAVKEEIREAREQKEQIEEAEVEERSATELLKELSGVKGRPLMHATLEKAVKEEVLHKRTCPADKERVLKELWDFVKHQ